MKKKGFWTKYVEKSISNKITLGLCKFCANGKNEKGLNMPQALYFLCDPGGGRTHDPKIKSLLLYQLSYGVKKPVCF
jgi:hypothetical protein